MILDTKPMIIQAGNTAINAFITQVDMVTLLQGITVKNSRFNKNNYPFT